MLDIQLGRRNLTPIQRIAVAEKYRPIYEKQAKENQGKRNDLTNNIPQNIGESEKRKKAKDREVNSKLASVANVNPETYRQAKRVLDSDNEELKKEVLSGETSISAAYKELTQNTKTKNEEIKNTNGELNSIPYSPINTPTPPEPNETTDLSVSIKLSKKL